MRTITMLALALGTLLTVGCGGGGGADAPAQPTATVAITSSNQGAVARATIDGSQAIGSVQGLAETDRVTAQSVRTTSSMSGLGTVESVARAGLEAAFSPRRNAGILSAARPEATSSSSVSCPAGGTITTTVNVSSSQAPTAGDSITITFNQCKESASELLTGALVFTIASGSSSSTSVQLSGTMAFQGVTAVSGQNTGTITGTVGVAASITSTTFQMVLTIGADGLTVVSAAPGFSDSIVYDPGMSLGITVNDGVGASSTVTLNGSFSASAIGGRVIVSTVAPVVTLGTDAHPTSGQVVVTGASGTHLRVTALSNTQAELELDANGDGAYETNAVVTWANLGTS